MSRRQLLLLLLSAASLLLLASSLGGRAGWPAGPARDPGPPPLHTILYYTSWWPDHPSKPPPAAPLVPVQASNGISTAPQAPGTGTWARAQLPSPAARSATAS
jgi:hypothetical protein